MESDSSDGCTTLKVLKATVLYALKFWILCYVNFTPIKKKDTTPKKPHSLGVMTAGAQWIGAGHAH